ncbi:hypothetical protein [Nocardioides sp. Soil796]|uniref:hypothetical protein n=1 Tax=Nocardioides sp. Soil796 TaxID=1736412 RepID=UPI00070D34EA|nr:hypothetical protein [Nocardioides sp. Soil796]KRF16118.1 hypothetical protein ASH02_05850 [Nocardioides sp. Soil796]
MSTANELSRILARMEARQQADLGEKFADALAPAMSADREKALRDMSGSTDFDRQRAELQQEMQRVRRSELTFLKALNGELSADEETELATLDEAFGTDPTRMLMGGN